MLSENVFNPHCYCNMQPSFLKKVYCSGMRLTTNLSEISLSRVKSSVIFLHPSREALVFEKMNCPASVSIAVCVKKISQILPARHWSMPASTTSIN